MANATEISSRIKSIRDTMKITKAMYMMSSMKLRQAKQKLEKTEPYFYALQEEIADIFLHFPEMRHLYFDNRDEDLMESKKRRAYLVITGDRGMAGAYNHNVEKEAHRLIEGDEDYHLMVVGEIGRQYFSSVGYELEHDFGFTASHPSIHRARTISEAILELYDNSEIDEVYVIYTRMINSMQMVVEVEEVLPLKQSLFVQEEQLEQARREREKRGTKSEEAVDDWYEIYPSPEVALEKLVRNYLTGFVYGVLVESVASEENTRMIAMQSATDNAQAMLHELSIEYNRVRQAKITQEITEVIGGAKALRKKKEMASRGNVKR